MCRSYLRRVAGAIPEITAAGAGVVVVTPQSSARAGAWRDELGLRAALVLADPDRTLYRALGARRPVPFWVVRPRVLSAGLRAVRAREALALAPGDDALQLGADLVIDRQGRIVLLHLGRDAADRVPPEDLIAVVRGLAS